MWRKGNPHALLVKIQISTAIVGNSMEFPQKFKNGTALSPSNSSSGIYLKKSKTLIQKNICIPMFISALFTMAKILKQPMCPSIDEWIKMLWYIYTIKYYSAIKKNEILLFATTWINLEGIMLSEISQSEKDRYHII